MIPKIIHYCWFGNKTLPKSAQKCIASWKRYFPDYEIYEWNETNFDVNIIPFTQEAYERKKYAFVSDYARFWILYHYGGLYFDTDVQVIRPMDDVLARGAFMGIEKSHVSLGVNPGLGLATVPNTMLYETILNYYAHLHFVDTNGKQISGTIVKHTTDVLTDLGFVCEDRMQQISDVWIYPNDWFNPLDDATGHLAITNNTCSIHLYAKTWVDNYGPLRRCIMRRLHRILGVDRMQWFKQYIKV